MCKKTFVGSFFFVTEGHMFQVTIANDGKTSPTLEKIDPKTGEVTEKINGGFYLAITGKGVGKYDMEAGQTTTLPVEPKRVERLDCGKKFVPGTLPPVAFFLRRSSATKCSQAKDLKAFDRRWKISTVDVLDKIGHYHPVITLSTESSFAIPELFLPALPEE